MRNYLVVQVGVCLLLLLTLLLPHEHAHAEAGVSRQIDVAPLKPYVKHVDSGDKRTYTLYDILLNDEPTIISTAKGMESFEGLYTRNPLAFESNVASLVTAIKGITNNGSHTGWSGKVFVNGNVIVDKFTSNGFIGETYSLSEVSEAFNRYRSEFPQDFVSAVLAKGMSAKIFKVTVDSRHYRHQKFTIPGGYKFTASSNHSSEIKVGDDVQLLYYDNFVFLTVTLDADISSTCPDGSAKPDNGACDGDIPPPPPDGGGGGGGGGCTTDCTPPPPPPPPDTPKECHPSAQGSYPNCTAGSVDISEEIEKEVTPSWGTGEISWGLSKASKSPTGGSATQIASTNLLPIGTGHYEALTPQYMQSGVMSGGQGKTTPKNVTASDKGTELYAVNYDYTNFYVETYKCNAPAESTVTQTHISGGVEVDYDVTAYDYNNCYEAFSESSSYWDKVDERANWAKGETYACTQPLAVDHSYGATLTGTNSATGTWNIGRHADVQAYANSCNVTANQVFTETLSHTSAHKELNTQTYIEFVENPIVWQGNPNYDTTSVIPYVADTTSQGNMGVPELDEVFKKNNKYTNKFNGFEYDYNIPLRQDVTGLSMDIYSKDDFWVSRSTGFVYSVPFPSTAGSALNEVSSKFQGYTGQAYRDTILNRPNLNSVYYLPIDANNNVMKPDTTYKLEMQVRNLGYNNITLHHKQTYLFKYYLLGSVFEEKNPNIKIKIVEQNEIPINDIKYPYSATINVAQGKSYSAATKGRTNFIFGHKATDAMAVFDRGRAIIGIDFGVRVNNPIKHVIDRESANDTLYTEW